MPKPSVRAKSLHRRNASVRKACEPVEQLEKRMMMARLTGIDVSHFQGTMNWNTAVSKGISFAMIRGSRTDTLPDTQLANNMNATTGAKAKGLIVGVYHRILPFSNTNDNGAFVDPIVDAQNFYNSAGSYMGTGYIRPIIDVENGASLNTTPVNGYTLKTWVLAWVNKLKTLTNNVTPILYTGHYRSNLNDPAVIAALPDLWIANWETATYGNPVTGSGSPPISPWSAWKFWQYDSPNGLGSQYGAQSTDIDLDVFNGDDIDVLKANFVVGATAIPTGPSPAHNATNVPPTNLTLNWNDTNGATRYDVYLDNMTTPIASNITVSQHTVASVTGGAHTWKVVAKPASNDDDTWVSSDVWSFTAATLPLPGAPANPTPANGAYVNVKPMTLDWDDSSNASSYQVWSGASLIGTVTSSQFGPISPLDGLRPWHVVAINATGSTTGPAWSFTMDTVAPTASYGNQTPTDGTTYLDFTVTYTDALSAIDASSLGSGDVRVQGPGGFDAAVVYQSVNTPGNGTPRTVTYRVAAPGGTWDGSDNGTYNIVQVASEVKDIAGTGNYRAAGTIGSFTMDTVAPTAAYGNQVPSSGAAFLDFTVTYADAISLIDFASLDLNDVRVTGPGGFDSAVSFISVDTAGNGTPRTVTYRVAAPGGTWDSADDGTYNIVQVASQVKDVPGNYRPPGTIGSFTTDTLAPTATYGNQTPSSDATYLDFTVTYADATSLVDFASLDAGDVRVTGPGGFDSAVSFISVDTAGNGTPRTVTYRVAAPGGTWNGADNGTYNIVQVASEVKDTAGAGNYRSAGNIGSFNVDLASFAWMTGTTLNVQFDGTSTPILLEQDLGGNVEVTKDGNGISFGGVTDINVMGTALDDTLQIQGGVTPPLTFTNGTGNDTVDVVGGSYTFASDLSPSASNVAVNVGATATATFASSQHLRNLTVAGTAVLSQGGAKIIVTKGLSVAGRLDLKDNDLVLDYIANDPSPLGTWDSGPGAYNGVLGLIASGRNGGDWTGNGLVTTESDAAAFLTYLGAARAGDLYGIGDSDTTTFGTETVDGSSILVKYTYTADADLNGELNGDDYFAIDSSILQSGTIFGQTVGDFDLNGEINGDDYFLLDSIILQAQSSGIIL